MTRKLILVVATLVVAAAALGVAAPNASAGCIASGGNTAWVAPASGHPEPLWDGAWSMQCTTNNGDWYVAQYYFDAYRNGSWTALPRTHQYPINHLFGPGNPLPTNYYFSQHWDVDCGFVSPLFDVPPYTQIRTEVLLTNQRTNATSHAVGPAQLIDTTNEYNCANGIGN